MRLIFWGTRGSIPTPGSATAKYGGNTPCVEVHAGGTRIVIDAGSGLRPLGQRIAESGDPAPETHLLISHSHWDHIQGFPFFAPVFNPRAKIVIYGCQGSGSRLERVLGMQMDDDHFPLSFRELAAEIRFVEISDNPFHIADVEVETVFLNHPGLALGFTLRHEGKKMSYCSDTEPFREPVRKGGQIPGVKLDEYVEALDRKIVQFALDADVMVMDAMFTQEEYDERIGWGHSSIIDAVSAGISAGAKRLYLFHHDPMHSDEFIDSMVARAREKAAEDGSSIEISGAMEGEEVEV